MKSLQEVMNKLIKDLGIEKKVLDYQVLNIWSDVVGKRIAEISKAEKIENKILIVKVLNSAWRNELLYHKKYIIDKLNKKVGKRVLDDLKLY
jgi:predicted nucleic acid-binding Zn ribbon protein